MEIPGFVNSNHASEAPSDIQRRSDYDSGTKLMSYLGYAPKGAATSDTKWLIYAFTYNADGQEVLKQTASGSWDGREDLTYA